MKPLMPDGSSAPGDIATVRKRAIVAALVQEALRDGDYSEALQVAAFNMLGFTSAHTSTPLAEMVAALTQTAQAARDHYLRQVAQ